MTRRVNLVLVIHQDKDKVLMCKRMKNPYKDKLNFVGGKIENGENDLEAAYRELQEETGITPQEIKLEHLVTFNYPSSTELQTYFGILEQGVELETELNPLEWVDLESPFNNLDMFAGNGNIEYLMHLIKYEVLVEA